MRRVALGLLVTLVFTGLWAIGRGRAAAEERGARPQACPRCAAPGASGANGTCPRDGSPLVRSDLVLFHQSLTRLASFDPKEPGFENPFRGLVSADGVVDVAALERLVQDYKAALASAAFGPFRGKLPLNPPLDPEAHAVAALRSIVTAEAIFAAQDRNGTGSHDFATLAQLARFRLVDEGLASGAEHGYAFSVTPSTRAPERAFFATALPAHGSGRVYFTNHTGVIYEGVETPRI